MMRFEDGVVLEGHLPFPCPEFSGQSSNLCSKFEGLGQTDMSGLWR
jgi:hypothetical protein